MTNFTIYSIELSSNPSAEEIKNALHIETKITAETSEKAMEIFRKKYPNLFSFGITADKKLNQPKNFPGI